MTRCQTGSPSRPAKNRFLLGVGVVLPKVAQREPMLPENYQLFRQCPVSYDLWLEKHRRGHSGPFPETDAEKPRL